MPAGHCERCVYAYSIYPRHPPTPQKTVIHGCSDSMTGSVESIHGPLAVAGQLNPRGRNSAT